MRTPAVLGWARRERLSVPALAEHVVGQRWTLRPAFARVRSMGRAEGKFAASVV